MPFCDAPSLIVVVPPVLCVRVTAYVTRAVVVTMTPVPDTETMLVTKMRPMLKMSVLLWAKIHAMSASTIYVHVRNKIGSWSKSEERGKCNTKDQNDGTSGDG